MREFGLIGFPLSHSFSKNFFDEKFATEKITDASYANFPITSINAFKDLWNAHPALEGVNVTIPYKKAVIPFLDYPSGIVQSMEACNCIRKYKGKFFGYNTDVIGFKNALMPFLHADHKKALVLGTGGAAAAVTWVLDSLNIAYKYVARSKDASSVTSNLVSSSLLTYDQLTPAIIASHKLIINTSPVGMFPDIENFPLLPYEAIDTQHHLFDLVYNPTTTVFLEKGLLQGASVQNGLEMLHIQAIESWRYWNAASPLEQS